jgi:hypothetical protein
LLSNPVGVRYLDALGAYGPVVYLRLDEYPLLPGVDPRLVSAAERDVLSTADACVVTARPLAPTPSSVYLPQGVDLEHFGRVPLEPSSQRVLGFFGLLAEWIDWELVRACARRLPSWRFEFIGARRSVPSEIAQESNIEILRPVPYAELPEAIAHWSAAWIPFRMNDLTRGVNPLKCREYLAAGLATFSAPLPALHELQPAVVLGETTDDVERFLFGLETKESIGARVRRRRAMTQHGWRARADRLRAIASGRPVGAPREVEAR